MEESLRLFKDVEDDDSFFNLEEENSGHELSQEELGEFLASSLRDNTPEPPPLLHPQSQPSFLHSFQDPQSSFSSSIPTTSCDAYSLPVSHSANDFFSTPSTQNGYFCENSNNSGFDSHGVNNGFCPGQFDSLPPNDASDCFNQLNNIPSTSAVSTAVFCQQQQIVTTTPISANNRSYPSSQELRFSTSTWNQPNHTPTNTVVRAQNIATVPQPQQIVSTGNVVTNDVNGIGDNCKPKGIQQAPLIIQQNGSGSSLPLQVVNGQLVIQAQLQHIQTNNGVVAVAVLQPVQVQNMLQQQQGGAQLATGTQARRSQSFNNSTLISSIPRNLRQPSTSPLVINNPENESGGVPAGTQQSNGLILAPSVTQSAQNFSALPQTNGSVTQIASKPKSRPLKPKPGAKKISTTKQKVTPNQGGFPVAQNVAQLAPAAPRETPGKLSIQLDPESARLVSQLNEQIDLLQSSGNSNDPVIQDTIARCQRERNAIFDAALQSQHGISASNVGQGRLPPPRPPPSVQPTILLPSGAQPQIVSMNGQSFMMVPSGARSQASPLPVQPVRAEPQAQQQYTSMHAGETQNHVLMQSESAHHSINFQTGSNQPSGKAIFHSATQQSQQNSALISAPSEVSPMANHEEERRRRMENRLKMRKERLKDWKNSDEIILKSAVAEVPFDDEGDVLARLLPFHLHDEPDFSHQFLESVDQKHTEMFTELERRKKQLESRFLSSKLKESSVTNPVWEECLVSNLMSWHEDDLLKMEQRLAKTNPEKLHSDLKSLLNSPAKPVTSPMPSSFYEPERHTYSSDMDSLGSDTPVPSPPKLEIVMPSDLANLSPDRTKLAEDGAVVSPSHESTSSTGTGQGWPDYSSRTEPIHGSCAEESSRLETTISSYLPSTCTQEATSSSAQQTYLSPPLNSAANRGVNSGSEDTGSRQGETADLERELLNLSSPKKNDPHPSPVQIPNVPEAQTSSQETLPERGPLKLRVKLKRANFESGNGAGNSWVASDSADTNKLRKVESKPDEQDISKEEIQHRKEKRRKQKRKDKEKRREERRRRAAMQVEEERQLTIPKLKINLKNLLPGNTDLSSINLIPFTSCQEPRRTNLPQSKSLPTGLEPSDSEDDDDDEEEPPEKPSASDQRKVSPLRLKPIKLSLQLPKNKVDPENEDEEFSDEFPSSPVIPEKSIDDSSQSPLATTLNGVPPSPAPKPIFSILDSDGDDSDEGGNTKQLINSALSCLETSVRIDKAVEGLQSDVSSWGNQSNRWCGFNQRLSEVDSSEEGLVQPQDPEASAAVGGLLEGLNSNLLPQYKRSGWQ